MEEDSIYSDVEIVREVYDSENAQNIFEKQLDRLLEAGVNIVVIEPNRLGDETARWLSVGRGLHNTSVCSGLGAIVAGFVWSDRPLFCCPFATLSLLTAGLYTLSWHFDPCCQYQVEKNPSSLAALTRRYPRANPGTSVVLVRKEALQRQRHYVHWSISLAATALCVFRLYAAFK